MTTNDNLTGAPHFELSRVYADGEREIELVRVSGMTSDVRMNRRGFLGTGMTMASVVGLLGAGCSSPPKATKPKTPVKPKARPKPKATTKPAEQPKSKPQPAEEPRADSAQEQIDSAPVVDTNCGDLSAHRLGVTGIAGSADGSVIASIGRDRALKIWRLPEGHLLRTQGSQYWISLALSDDASTLAGGMRDGRIRLFGMPGGKQLRELKTVANGAKALAFSRDGRVLYSAGTDRRLVAWDVASGREAEASALQPKPIVSIARAPGSDMLASAASDGSITLWRTTPLAPVRTFFAHPGAIASITFDATGAVLASTGSDNRVKTWAAATGAALGEIALRREDKGPSALAFDSASNRLVIGTRSGAVYEWDAPHGTSMRPLTPKGSRIAAAASAGSTIALGTGAGRIVLRHADGEHSLPCLVDLRANPSKVKGLTYRATNAAGQIVTYTLPCGSPIPAGATCTCNCVPGSYTTRRRSRSSGSRRICTCNKVCTCVPVRICQAHRLLHPDPRVADMAHEIVLLMGTSASLYLDWAARHAATRLRSRIRSVRQAIDRGEASSVARWPEATTCHRYLDHPDEVVAIMAAQFLVLRRQYLSESIAAGVWPRLRRILLRAHSLAARVEICMANDEPPDAVPGASSIERDH